MAIDLTQYSDVLGDPSAFFADEDRATPLVVEQATGAPRFALVGDTLVPFAAWRAGAAEPAPASFRGVPGQFQFNGTVS